MHTRLSKWHQFVMKYWDDISLYQTSFWGAETDLKGNFVNTVYSFAKITIKHTVVLINNIWYYS